MAMTNRYYYAVCIALSFFIFCHRSATYHLVNMRFNHNFFLAFEEKMRQHFLFCRLSSKIVWNFQNVADETVLLENEETL